MKSILKIIGIMMIAILISCIQDENTEEKAVRYSIVVQDEEKLLPLYNVKVTLETDYLKKDSGYTNSDGRLQFDTVSSFNNTLLFQKSGYESKYINDVVQVPSDSASDLIFVELDIKLKKIPDSLLITSSSSVIDSLDTLDSLSSSFVLESSSSNPILSSSMDSLSSSEELVSSSSTDPHVVKYTVVVRNKESGNPLDSAQVILETDQLARDTGFTNAQGILQFDTVSSLNNLFIISTEGFQSLVELDQVDTTGQNSKVIFSNKEFLLTELSSSSVQAQMSAEESSSSLTPSSSSSETVLSSSQTGGS